MFNEATDYLLIVLHVVIMKVWPQQLLIFKIKGTVLIFKLL